LIRDIRAENSRENIRALVLVVGDLLHGTPLSTVFRGEPDVECLNATGLDAVTVGNHELGFGLENYHRLPGRAAFAFLSANIVEKQSGAADGRFFQRLDRVATHGGSADDAIQAPADARPVSVPVPPFLPP